MDSKMYSNQLILAPMVRINSLPFRLLSLDYGAHLVYSEEIIDFRILKSRRILNRALETIDYIDNDHNIVFRTCDKEKGKIILQIGTKCPKRAVKVLQMVSNDVAGVDVNFGCPKHFSLKGGMGAALLTNPELIKEILTNLVQNSSIPITCKIRVLPDLDETLNLVKVIESSGVSALAVHGRTKEERPRNKNRDDIIGKIVETISIPVIANGGSSDILEYSDIHKFKIATNCSSVMIARAAEKNCSIFRKDGHLLLDKVICDYLKYCIDYDNHFTNVKYTIQQMLGSLQETRKGKEFLASQTFKDICGLWDMIEYYELKAKELDAKIKSTETNLHDNNPVPMKRKLNDDEDDDEEEIPLKFFKHLFGQIFPKTTLLNWAKNKGLKNPVYTTVQLEKHFYSVVDVENKRYKNSYLEKNKKYAEQGAALVALLKLGLIEESKISECFINDSYFLKFSKNVNSAHL